MIPFSETTAVLITKATVYPPEVLAHVASFPFAEIRILTGCAGPLFRYQGEKTRFIYVQDDDALCPIQQLMEAADPSKVTCAMKEHYIEEYAAFRFCLVGWGTVFAWSKTLTLNRYAWPSRSWDDDIILIREADRIFTYLNYPQKRLALPIKDMPWATDPDRLSMQPDHYKYRDEVLKRLEAM